LDFVLNLPPDSTRDDALISAVSAWSHEDAKAVTGWLDQVPESFAKQQASQQVSTIWATNDPQAAEAWLQNQPPGDSRDSAIVSYSSVIAHDTPAKAFGWTSQIQADGMRRHQLEILGARWLKQDPNDAQQAILQSNLSDSEKQLLLKTSRRSANQ